MLCSPIEDQYGKVIGACQAINKNGKAFFGQDDLYLFDHLTTVAGIILRNSMQFDESVILQHHFKSLITEGSCFLVQKDLREFMMRGEQMLRKRFEVEEARLYFHDYKLGKIYRYDHDGDRQEFEAHVGIVGHVISTGQVVNSRNGENDVYYHDKVDMQTTLPLHVRPINLPGREKTVIGAIEMVNKKGILGRSIADKVTMDQMTCEILDMFVLMVQQGLLANFITEEDVASFPKEDE